MTTKYPTVDQLLALLAIDRNVGPEAIRAASMELAAVGREVPASELTRALHTARAYCNPVTGEWLVPGNAPRVFALDELQEAVMSRTGLRGPALYKAWIVVKGHLRLRWAAGNYARPKDATVARWATA